jgi:hypothetical protein
MMGIRGRRREEGGVSKKLDQKYDRYRGDRK